MFGMGFIKQIKLAMQSANALKNHPTRWETLHGTELYPPKGGAIPGTEKTVVLQPGEKVQRFGYPTSTSKFVTEFGALSESLSLPPWTDANTLIKIEILKPVKATQSTVAPWGDSPGGGTQFVFERPLLDLIADGIIRIVP